MVPMLQNVFPGFVCPNAPADMFAAIGKGGQFLNVVPSQNMVWLRMGDEPTSSLVPFLLNDEIWGYINELACSTTGFEESYAPEHIQVYPNPANEQITVSVKAGRIGNVIIYNQLGVKIKEFNSNESSSTFTISGLAEGVYFMKIEGTRQMVRFIKT